MSYDVFLSHSTKDKAAAEAIVAYLEKCGIRCWCAPRDILPGCSWAEAIVKGIIESAVMVVVISENANRSGHIAREVERAVGRDTPVVPFRIQDVMPSGGLEYFLSASHWMDAITPPLSKHLPMLAQRLKDLIESTRNSTGVEGLKIESFTTAHGINNNRLLKTIVASCCAVLVVAAVILYRLNIFTYQHISQEAVGRTAPASQPANSDHAPLESPATLASSVVTPPNNGPSSNSPKNDDLDSQKKKLAETLENERLASLQRQKDAAASQDKLDRDRKAAVDDASQKQTVAVNFNSALSAVKSHAAAAQWGEVVSSLQSLRVSDSPNGSADMPTVIASANSSLAALRRALPDPPERNLRIANFPKSIQPLADAGSSMAALLLVESLVHWDSDRIGLVNINDPKSQADFTDALKYGRMAIDDTVTPQFDACPYVGDILLKSKTLADNTAAFRYLQMGVDAGNVDSIARLGAGKYNIGGQMVSQLHMSASEPRVLRMLTEGRALLEKAADQGSPQAEYDLGVIFERDLQREVNVERKKYLFEMGTRYFSTAAHAKFGPAIKKCNANSIKY